MPATVHPNPTSLTTSRHLVVANQPIHFRQTVAPDDKREVGIPRRWMKQLGNLLKEVPLFRETSKKGPFWGKYLFSLRNYESVENDPNLGKEMFE